jgi:hypothetical protein
MTVETVLVCPLKNFVSPLHTTGGAADRIRGKQGPSPQNHGPTKSRAVASSTTGSRRNFTRIPPKPPPPTCPTLARAAPPHAAGTTRRVRCWAAMEGEGVCVWPRRLATCICMPTARSRRQGKNFESGSAYSSRGGGGTACAGGGAGRSPERCVWCARVAGCGTTTPHHTAHSAQRTAHSNSTAWGTAQEGTGAQRSRPWQGQGWRNVAAFTAAASYLFQLGQDGL